MRSCHRTAICLTCTVLASAAAGQTSIIDADDFPAGTDISTAFPGVTLSQSGNPSPTSAVFSCAVSGGSITGSRVFGWRFDTIIAPNFNHPALLRADFVAPANFVAITALSISSGGDDVTLRAFDAGNQLLGTVNTSIPLGSTQTLSFSRPQSDIAYITVGGSISSESARLDTLQWSSTGILTFRRCCMPNGTCLLATSASCASIGGTSSSLATCEPGICPAAGGACCLRGGACVVVDAAACAGASGRFLGSGQACRLINNTGACCAADLNASGAVTVQDIFDFLAVYFGGCP